MSSMPSRDYTAYGPVVAQVDQAARAGFIRRTYGHLAFAVALFVGIEAAIFMLVPQETLLRLGTQMLRGWSWLLVMFAFMAVSMIAQKWASAGSSRLMQYMGLLLYVVAEAVIFIPLLLFTSGATFTVADRAYSAVAAAGVMTGVLFGGLTVGIFITGTDLSGWGKYLGLLGLAALGVIVCSLIFGLNLGIWFNCAMITLMCGYILYQTSNVLHHYHTDQHVAASLALFASVATLFWYVLLLFGGRRD